MGIKHPFSSIIADGPTATKVRPSNWNTDHIIDGDVDFGGFDILNVGNAAVLGTYSVEGLYYDIRDYGVVVAGGDITAAVQATIDAAEAGTPGFNYRLLKRLVIPNMGDGGQLTLGAVTFSDGNWVIEIFCKELVLSSTFNFPGSSMMRGHTVIGGGNVNQWASGPNIYCLADPGILMDGCINCQLENLGINSSVGTPLFCTRTEVSLFNRLLINNNSAPVGTPTWVLDSGFWCNIRDCLVTSQSSASAGYAIDIVNTDAASPVASGLYRFTNILTAGAGVRIKNTYIPAASIWFDQILMESAASGVPLFTIDTSDGLTIEDITIRNPGIADSGVPQYYLKNIGSRTHNVRIEDISFENETIMDPTSTEIHGLSVGQIYGQFAGFADGLQPSWSAESGQEWIDTIDKRLICAPRGPQVVVGTAMPVPQDPNDWAAYVGSVTITPGILAPDGTLNAGQIASDGGETARLFDSAYTTSVAVGDWFIAGMWLQLVSPLSTIAGYSYPSLLMQFNIDDTGGFFSGAGLTVNLKAGGESQMRDGKWHWVCSGGKIGGVGNNPAFTAIRLIVGGWTNSNVCNVFNPSLQYIPVSAGWTDYDIVTLIKSYRGGWAPGAIAGDVGTLDHQMFRAKRISTPTKSTLTIAGGIVTATGSYHLIDTEAAAATDDLDTINGGVDGMRLIVRAADSARTVVAKDGTGNLQLAGDFSLDNAQDTIELIYDAALTAWLEIGRSDNGA